MTIIDAQRLNRYLSEPQWSPGQWEEAADICEETEDSLGSRLVTYITPVPYVETVTVLATGLVATSHPVARVTKLNGVPITDAAPLSADWRLTGTANHWLRYVGTGQPPVPQQSWSLMTGWTGVVGTVDRVDGIGQAVIEYMAGWGDIPAIRRAILKKAGAIMINRHDDTVVARALDAQQPPPIVNEEWTADELAPLGTYRNLQNGVFR